MASETFTPVTYWSSIPLGELENWIITMAERGEH